MFVSSFDRKPLSRYYPYLIAIVGPILVTLFRFSVRDFAEDKASLVFFGIPIAAAAITGGFLPGFIALGLGFASGTYFFMPVVDGTRYSTGADIFASISFLVTWLLVSIICETARRSSAAKRSSMQLREDTERRLLEVLNRITDGLVTVDSQGRIEMANRSALELFGAPMDDVVGKHVWELVDRETQPILSERLERALSKEVPTSIDVPVANNTKWYQYRIFPSPKNQSDAIFIQDITAIRMAELSRERLLMDERNRRSDAEKQSRAKDDFVAMLSHELRTPMTAILGWTEILLKQNKDNPKVADGIASIDRAAHVQAKMIEELLDVSRIATGKLSFNIEIVDLREQIEEVMLEQRPIFQREKKNLEFIADEGEFYVRLDPGRLQQIIKNLIANSLKFTEQDGNIRVMLRRQGNIATIVVEDDGQGIDEQTLPIIFNRFRQGKTTFSRRYGGLGLGLAIVQQLVIAQGGTVVAESQGVGLGSKFTVRFPMVEPFVHAAHTAEVDDEVSLSGMSILLIEDDLPTQAVLDRLFTLHGASVTSAATAQEGLEILRSHVPDVLVSDIGLPELDGYDLIETIRNDSDEQVSRVPALALTAFAGAEDRDRAYLAGFDAHASKPVESAKLLQTIVRLAAKPKHLRSA